MKLSSTRYSRTSAPRAFTIIEIALCLGIIGFALIAIIAVLPRGLDVQKRNREETIIGQDAEVWMSAIRSGSRGYDDLTNYVICITNFWTRYDDKLKVLDSGYDFYNQGTGVVTSVTPPPTAFPLTNGARIIGLLSTPKRLRTNENIFPIDPPYQSNYVVAYVRAFSGSVVTKVPQTNAIILNDAFTYRMIVENFPYVPFDTNAICMQCPATNGLSFQQLVDRTNLAHTIWMMQTNAYDIRLRFRWPVLANGQIPNYGLATFRSLANGALLVTNDLNFPEQKLYFVQPQIVFQGSRNPPQ
jgi:type II secretory pathway pseudopilin PulG